MGEEWIKGGTNSAHAEEGLEGCRKSEEAGEEVEGVAEVEDLVVTGPAEEALEDAGVAEVVDLAIPVARESPNVQRSAIVTGRRSAEQNAHSRWCRQRLFISPSSLPLKWRHQLVDAGSGRGRVLGRAGS